MKLVYLSVLALDWLEYSYVLLSTLQTCLDTGPINEVKFISLGSGYFMHFSTGRANTGDKALLESRLLYPQRGYQCLQFFYYNSAGPSDTLKVYVREYDKANPNGSLRLIKTIEGDFFGNLTSVHNLLSEYCLKYKVCTLAF